MSVKIRLALTGKSHQISYRLVAQDSRAKRDGKFLEILGYYNPHQKENGQKIDKERVKYYLSNGATFTPSAKYLFENGKLPPKPKKVREEKSQKTQAQQESPAQATLPENKGQIQSSEVSPEPTQNQEIQAEEINSEQKTEE